MRAGCPRSQVCCNRVREDFFSRKSVDSLNGRNAVLTTQLAMPDDICAEVYDAGKGYKQSKANFANARAQLNVPVWSTVPAQPGTVLDGFSTVVWRGDMLGTAGVPPASVP